MKHSQKPSHTVGLIKTFLPYFKPYKKVLVFDLFCAMLTTVCELVLPLIVRYITDMGINDLQNLTVGIILTVGAFYIFLRIIDAMANYYMSSVGHIMGSRIETDMRRDLFCHLQLLSNSYYDNTKIGQLMSRITSDLFDVTEFAHHCPEELFISSVKIIGSFCILCRINVLLTIIIFSILPIMLVVSTYFNRKMKHAFRLSRVQVGEINSQVEDSLLGMRVVKSFANEDIEQTKFMDGNNKFLAIKQLTYKCMARFHTTTRLFDGIMYIAVVIAGSLFMINYKVTPGDLMAYLLYVTTLLTSIRKLIEFTEQFQRGMTGIERFSEVMNEPVETKDIPDAKPLENVKGNIRFENICFGYNDDSCVLHNVNIDIKPGDNVALVGPSGSGKTTICNLIPRFYEVTDGKILIDGKDIKTVTLKSLRSNIGVVQQDVYMFSGTVYENIEYGRPGASESEIIEASKQAGAHEFIMNLKDGYHTYVGERGVKLSGGQKQRLSIARVFLKNPPILILDEATSALDNESERIVQHSLEQLAKGRTSITIAHRLSTIRNSTTILVLTENGIVERGNHEELINLHGVYYNLYNIK